MGSREINIEFTQEQIEMYNGKGYRLCFGIGVGQNPAFNVIAEATTITPKVTFQWNDEFRIAATNERFENGGTITIATSHASIKFDQVYTLPPTWYDGDVTNEKLPGKSFKMVNETSRGAGAVLFRRINGQYMPFYVSNPPIESNGSELLTPKLRVALWFQANAETGAMVSLNKADLSTFDFSGRNQVNLKCNGGQFVAT